MGGDIRSEGLFGVAAVQFGPRGAVDVRTGGRIGCSEVGGGALGRTHHNALKQRTSEDEFTTSGLNRVQAQGAPHEPSAHLTAVLVAAQTLRRSVVEVGANVPDPVCSLERRSRIRGQIAHVVAGLVAVGILAPKSCDVGLDASGGLDWGVEHGVNLGQKSRVTSRQRRLALNVVLGGKQVLPRVGLREVEVHLSWLKAFIPSSFSLGLDESAGGVVQVFPMRRTLAEPTLHFPFVEVARHPGNACVVKGVLQGLGHTLVFMVRRDVAKLGIGIQAQMHAVCSLDHGVEGQVLVPVVNAPSQRVNHDRYAVVPNHAAGVIRGQFPHRQLSALLVHPEHGAHHVSSPGRFNPRQQGMQRPVSVPQAEDGVVVPFVGAQSMHLEVRAAVAAVDVAGQVGHGRGVVQGGVERGPFRRGAALDLNAAELVIPARLVGGQVGVKPKIGSLCLQIGEGPFDVAEAQSHMHVQLRNQAKICHKHGHHGHFLLDRPIGQRVGFGDDPQLISPLEVAVELHREVHVLLLRPILGHTVPDEHA